MGEKVGNGFRIDMVAQCAARECIQLMAQRPVGNRTVINEMNPCRIVRLRS